MKRKLIWVIVIVVILIIGSLILIALFRDNVGTVSYKLIPDNCETDTYNCDDFASQTEAQSIFDECGFGDIHNLDLDDDGIACEGLP